MSYARGFASGLALGISVGAGVLLGAFAVKRHLRMRSERGQGPFIDGVHAPDTVIADWTLQHEANSPIHDHLCSEAPDVSAESQRW